MQMSSLTTLVCSIRYNDSFVIHTSPCIERNVYYVRNRCLKPTYNVDSLGKKYVFQWRIQINPLMPTRTTSYSAFAPRFLRCSAHCFFFIALLRNGSFCNNFAVNRERKTKTGNQVLSSYSCGTLGVLIVNLGSSPKYFSMAEYKSSISIELTCCRGISKRQCWVQAEPGTPTNDQI